MAITPEKNLCNWFKKNAAVLPWRLSDFNKKRDPYIVWISEIMLQQTQVTTVYNYFIRWVQRFPDIQTLAKANELEIFEYWQGLGYYSRAKNILRTAKIIANLGQFPKTRKDLEALPGIGAYTAGAILSLAFHKPEAILDGNLIRIFSRMYELNFLPSDKKECHPKSIINNLESCKSYAEIYWDYARTWANHPKGYIYNESLMELGRTICKVKNPKCDICPLNATCRAFIDNRVQEFPPSKKHLQKNWHGIVLIIESSDNKYLAIRGGQTFFKGQLCLPHFETLSNATLGIPIQAESYIDSNNITSATYIGKFSHNITVHKIECDVLHIKLNSSSSNIIRPQIFQLTNNENNITEIIWVPKDKAKVTFANTFSLKALKKCE